MTTWKHRLAITVMAVAALLPTFAQAGGGLLLYEIATSDVGLASVRGMTGTWENASRIQAQFAW